MFTKTRTRITNAISHENTQKALRATIITTRKVNQAIRKEATTLKDQTKTTWKEAMEADIS